jgi:hypothetical protein
MAFPTAANNRADRGCRLTPPNPLPCQAWHCNKVTIAHHEEAGVSADGRASALPSGAVAAAPPAAAFLSNLVTDSLTWAVRGQRHPQRPTMVDVINSSKMAITQPWSLK